MGGNAGHPWGPLQPPSMRPRWHTARSQTKPREKGGVTTAAASATSPCASHRPGGAGRSPHVPPWPPRPGPTLIWVSSGAFAASDNICPNMAVTMTTPLPASPDKNGSMRTAGSAWGPGAGIPSQEPPRSEGTQQPCHGHRDRAPAERLLSPSPGSQPTQPPSSPSASDPEPAVPPGTWGPACAAAPGLGHHGAAGTCVCGVSSHLSAEAPGEDNEALPPAARPRGTAAGMGQHRKTHMGGHENTDLDSRLFVGA